MFMVWAPISCRCVIVHPWIPRCQSCEQCSHHCRAGREQVILLELTWAGLTWSAKASPDTATNPEMMMTPPQTKPRRLNELNITPSVGIKITRIQLFTRFYVTCPHSILSSLLSTILGREKNLTGLLLSPAQTDGIKYKNIPPKNKQKRQLTGVTLEI